MTGNDTENNSGHPENLNENMDHALTMMAKIQGDQPGNDGTDGTNGEDGKGGADGNGGDDGKGGDDTLAKQDQTDEEKKKEEEAAAAKKKEEEEAKKKKDEDMKHPAPPATPDHDGTSSTAERGGKLSPLITQAVSTTNASVLGDQSSTLNGSVVQIEGAGMAFQKVAQAAAISVQDSSDYMRNIMAIASTAQGVAMKKMIETKSPQPWGEIMVEAQKAVSVAQLNMAAVGASSAQVVKDFDPSA